MDQKTYNESLMLNQSMNNMGQGIGSIAKMADEYKQKKMMMGMGNEMLETIKNGGMQALTPQALASMAQKYSSDPNAVGLTLALIKSSGAAAKAMEEFNSQVALTNQRNAITGKTNAETETENALRDPRVYSEKALGYQRQTAGNLNDANTNQVNTLTPVKVREGESRIAVNGSAANLNNTRAGDIIAKQPGEIDATKALTEQRRAAATQNEAGGKANHVGQFLQSVGVKPGTMVSSVKDGSVNFTEKYVTGRQASDIMAAAKQQGIAIKGQGVWDKAGNLTGFYMTSAVYDPATAATQRLVTERPKAGKPIDKATVTKFIMQAGGDVDKARQMAKQQGYSF